MELGQLRIFVAAAEGGGFSQAARRLYLSHSTVSRCIRALERELGVPLVRCSPHDFRLTEAGEALLEEARALLRAAEQAQTRVRDAGNKEMRGQDHGAL